MKIGENLFSDAAFVKSEAISFSSFLTAVEFVLVFIAWWLMYKAHNDRLRDRWRVSRFGAEVTDGLINTAWILNPLRPTVAAQNPRWRRFAVSLGLLARDTTPAAETEVLRKAYKAKRIEYQRAHYFEKQQSRSKRLKHWLHKTESLTTVAAPPIIFIALLLKLTHTESDPKAGPDFAYAAIAMFLPVILPLTAGAALSMLVATDAGRRADRYRDMARRLTRFNQLLEVAETKGSLQETVAEAEELLLDELSEWDTAASQAGG